MTQRWPLYLCILEAGLGFSMISLDLKLSLYQGSSRRRTTRQKLRSWLHLSSSLNKVRQPLS